VFDTRVLPVDERFEAWVERMGRTHAPMDLHSDRTADYRGRQRVFALGEVTVWPATFDPLVFRRTPKLIRQSDPESYHLSLLLRGAGGAVWGGRQLAYGLHDFHVNDSSRSWEIHTGDDPVTLVGLELPRALVPLPAGRARRVIGQQVSGNDGIGALLAQFLVRLASDTGSYQPSDAPRLGIVAADLVAAVFAHVLEGDVRLPPETHGRTLTLRIKAFIHANLGDAELTPARIAAAHYISRSYLHRLFQPEGVTVAAFVRRQRLEQARRDLADPAQRALPVHAVAARWGFPRAAEFSRAFRTAYGMAPSEHRHAAGGRIA